MKINGYEHEEAWFCYDCGTEVIILGSIWEYKKMCDCPEDGSASILGVMKGQYSFVNQQRAFNGEPLLRYADGSLPT